MYSIMKIKRVPLEVSEYDEALMTGVESDALEDSLINLGYGKDVTRIHMTADATAVRCKGRTEGVYVKYHRNKHLIALIEEVTPILSDSLATVGFAGSNLMIHFDERILGVIRIHNEEDAYTYSLDTDWDDFFGEDAIQVDNIIVSLAHILKKLDPYYSTYSVEHIMSYAFTACVPKN